MKFIIKKISSYLLILSLLLNNFAPIIIVHAQSDDISVEIVSLYQNVDGVEIELVKNHDNIFQLQSLNKIRVVYNVEGLKSDDEALYINVENSSDFEFGHGPVQKNVMNGENEFIFTPRTLDFIAGYTLTISKEVKGGPLEIIARGYINTYSSELNDFLYGNPSLKVIEMTQGGKSITEVEGNYIVNDMQDIIVKIKGENFSELYKYIVVLDVNRNTEFNKEEPVILTKNDIEKEQTFIIKSNDLIKSEGIYNYIRLMWSIVTDDGVSTDKAIRELNLTPRTDESLPKFNFNVIYKNFDSIILNAGDSVSSPPYVFDIRKYNENNPLIISINGSKYLEQDYEVKLSIYNGENNKEVYHMIYNVNGKVLNDVYSITIDDFVPTISENFYHYFTVEINETTKKALFSYKDIGTIGAEFYYANGMKNNRIGSGAVDINYFAVNYITSTREFNNENPITVFFKGYDFYEITNYKYELSYTLEETDDKGVHISNVIKSGTFIGSEFNDKGLTHNVEFQDGSIWSVNLDVFNNDDDLVYGFSVGFSYGDMESLANVKLKSYNKYLFEELSHDTFQTTYLTTNTEPLEIEVNGVGFEDDMDYDYTILARNESDEEQDGSLMSGTIKGSEINKGTAVIKYNKMLSYPKDYIIYISFEELMFGDGEISLEVVKSKEYLDNGDFYSIDNLDGFIKGTFYDKNSSVILDEINLKNNHTAKIFTKDGEETSGVVATGMIAKIYNGNGDVKIDMEIVIKGDITGNGNITLTDTVKMKRTVAGLESLTGVYAAAGDINDDGKISLTDAIKVTRHFAGIEEIK